VPKLKPETQQARRDHILDAAERCFAKNGFHGTTMQMLCKEADVSPGAFYVYFASKEALIAGISERNRSEFSERLSQVADNPDVLTAMNQLADQYFVDDPQHKLAMAIEIGAESIRNETVRELHTACDQAVAENLTAWLTKLNAQKRIDPTLPIEDVTQLMQIIGDGLLWRRALEPSFDAEKAMPAILTLLGMLLGTPAPASFSSSTAHELYAE